MFTETDFPQVLGLCCAENNLPLSKSRAMPDDGAKGSNDTLFLKNRSHNPPHTVLLSEMRPCKARCLPVHSVLCCTARLAGMHFGRNRLGTGRDYEIGSGNYAFDCRACYNTLRIHPCT